jgi:transposase
VNNKRLWVRLLGVEGAVIEDVQWQPDEGMLVRVRAGYKHRQRCPHCGRRCAWEDNGDGPRRWRGLDLALVQVWLVGEAPRVRCRQHGVVVAAVPWARHGARFVRSFEDQVAWLVTQMSRSAVAELMRISWRSVGRIIERVVGEARERVDLLEGLVRIGIDEVSYKKGHRYLMVVVDHDRDRLVYAAEGRNAETVSAFFEALGPERCKQIEFVSADGALWIEDMVRQHCPSATLCTDPFHVVKWATDALDRVRRDVWNRLRRSHDLGDRVLAESLKRSRYALWKNPDNLTQHQQHKLAEIQRVNNPLWRAYLLKEQLRELVVAKGRAALRALPKWLAWAARCRLEPFVELGRRIRRHLPGIEAALRHGLSNARVESANTRIRLLHRLAFGFHSAQPAIALAFLKIGGLCPPLPGRA